MASANVGIVGASGYLGNELVRLLSGHPSMNLKQAISTSQGGRTLGEICPFLGDKRDLVLERSPDVLDVDLAFLAGKSGEAMGQVPSLRQRGIKVVDLSADYRLKDPAVYQTVYGETHRDLDGLASAVYGLTEFAADAVRSADLVANPGCYPTAALLGLVPLRRAGLLPASVVIDAKSGSSGAGATPTPESHHSRVASGVQPYGGGRHRHGPEIDQALGSVISADGAAPPTVAFVPHLVPLVRGLMCTTYAPAISDEVESRWAETLTSAYASSPFIHVATAPPRWPWVVGSNACWISTERSGGTGVVYSVIDNLIKGGAGQAIQNANLMLGLPPTDGLPLNGLGL